MSREKEPIEESVAESILGEPISHHRADWHFRDKRNRERCDLLSVECPLIHFTVSVSGSEGTT